MTAKEYLNQAFYINSRIDGKLKKAEMLRKSLYGRGLNYENNGSNPNSSGDALGRAVAKVVDYENEANNMIDRLVSLRLEIETVIAEVVDDTQREVLERRYLYFQPWAQISLEMHYSVQHLYRIHGEALKNVDVPQDESE